MIRFPNAKINLGLRIVARRPDGYHNIETVFYPVQLQDALEIVPTSQQETELSLSGIVIDGDPQNNLVMKAWRRLSHRFSLPPISIYLHKAIPFGAGLGGGSSDAAFLFAMVRDYFRLPLSDDELDKEAASLGADCPVRADRIVVEVLSNRIGKAFCLRAYVGGLFVGYSGIAGRVGEGYRFPSGRGVER